MRFGFFDDESREYVITTPKRIKNPPKALIDTFFDIKEKYIKIIIWKKAAVHAPEEKEKNINNKLVVQRKYLIKILFLKNQKA